MISNVFTFNVSFASCISFPTNYFYIILIILWLINKKDNTI